MQRRSTTALFTESPSLDPRHRHGINSDPPSPSLTYRAEDVLSSSVSCCAESPSHNHTVLQRTLPSPSALSKQITKPKPKTVSTTKSFFVRASRMARARNPSSVANDTAYQIVAKRFKEIRSMGLERAPKDVQAFRSHKVNLGSGGKGPGVRTCTKDQCKMNHLACAPVPKFNRPQLHK